MTTATTRQGTTSTLSIWKFDTPQGAETALGILERLQVQRLVVVDDASVVTWPVGRRRPRTYQAGSFAGAAALSGAFWGLLFGLLFLLPLAGLALGAAAGAAVGLTRIGLSDEFLQQIRDKITPGTSALFLLTHAAVVDRLAEAFAGAHAELLVSNLSHDEEAALRQAFDADH
ncbi:DUF1269 domain-containing protein [Pseudonocardia charpentierae]|uniref:DUF1269 domain-containing protein n=1 Tax=Pseudonocardia charpentierae TaxID=3075545 RepID=A0ABU2NJQ2_9PSEU|nr:DUF1269 domain-containing protein [Pseudonocardia sp. DSM 45834]MDT0352839.1 DUF1269 domain-containing protein [Pseudonocardia sp. DSM 45834]